jgi:MFS family permease
MQSLDFIQKKSFAILFVSLFVSMLGLGVISPLMSLYAESLGVTGVWLGIIFSGYNLSRAFVMPVVGGLSDRLRRRNLFLALGMIFFGLASVGYVFSSDAVHLFFTRFLQGFGAGMVLPIATAYVGDFMPKGREGTYIGFISVARTLGWGSGPLLGGFLLDLFGFEVPFYVMGILAFASFVLILIGLPKHEVRGGERTGSSFKKILNNRTLRGLVLYRAVNAIGTGNLFSFFPLFADSIGLSSAEVGILLSSRILVLSLLQVPFGVLADRYDKTKLVLLSGIVSAVLLVLIPFSTNFIELLLIGLFIGISWAVSMPSSTALAAEFGREYGMASVISTVNFGFSVGMIIGPLIAGLIMDFLNLQAVFYFGGITSIIGITLFYFLVH